MKVVVLVTLSCIINRHCFILNFTFSNTFCVGKSYIVMVEPVICARVTSYLACASANAVLRAEMILSMSLRDWSVTVIP